MKGVVSKLKRHNNIKKYKIFKEAWVQRNINHIRNQMLEAEAPPYFSKN